MSDSLDLGDHFPKIQIFRGTRAEFLSEYCRTASVVLFTGRYENFLRVERACSNETLLLYNGVGHNPIVVTPSADLDLAVQKTVHVKLFNNGQDCAGPDIILVHSGVVDAYLDKLFVALAQVQIGSSYSDDDVVVGPLFETSSLLHAVNLVFDMQHRGATISYGGQIDLRHNIVYPCVLSVPLRQLQNYVELYSPLFLVTEYNHDRELSLYFNDSGARYQRNEMYISLFGESDYITEETLGSIILKECTIYDVERGTEEYGGYSTGGSLVSYRGMRIPKPLLIPREIHNFLSLQGQRIFTSVPTAKGNWEQQIVATQFQENVQRIFGEELVFAYIFGSFAVGRDKRYSDIDTFICVHNRQVDHVEKYLDWLFALHGMFGRIPDLKYPAEIVSFMELQAAVTRLSTLELSAIPNGVEEYDVMVWCHSLSQPWIGAINPENVPEHWKQHFPIHSSRILRSFLADLDRAVVTGADISQLHPEIYEIPREEPATCNFINNLVGRGLIDVLKMIPFVERPVYGNIMLQLVSQREFIGRSVFDITSMAHLYHPHFRFGVGMPIS